MSLFRGLVLKVKLGLPPIIISERKKKKKKIFFMLLSGDIALFVVGSR